jgi:hypothetical protein
MPRIVVKDDPAGLPRYVHRVALGGYPSGDVEKEREFSDKTISKENSRFTTEKIAGGICLKDRYLFSGTSGQAFLSISRRSNRPFHAITTDSIP